MKTCYLIVPVLVECCCEKWHTSAIGQYIFMSWCSNPESSFWWGVCAPVWNSRLGPSSTTGVSMDCGLLWALTKGFQWSLLRYHPTNKQHCWLHSLLSPRPLLFHRLALVPALPKICLYPLFSNRRCCWGKGSWICVEGVVRAVLKAM